MRRAFVPPEIPVRRLGRRDCERTVREIRVVAERDYYDIEEWDKAVEFKDKACRAFAEEGLSYVYKRRRE